MLKHLRFELTLLYLISAMVLAISIGAGTYSLISYYFQASTDQALKVKMGLQFASLDLPLPLDLYQAVHLAGLVITLTPNPTEMFLEENHTEKHEELQESELADIYVIPLTSNGDIPAGFSASLSNTIIDQDARAAALARGFDFRTINTQDGSNVRLLTYRVSGLKDIQLFQIGRYLNAQKIVLRNLMNTMILLGGIVILFIGFVAWILAGRTIRPTQQAWEKQQAFVANASHELRTPLTLMRAGTEVAYRNAESPEEKQLLSDVLTDADHMNHLIEELLLLSRLDSHAFDMDIQNIHLSEQLPEILRPVMPTAELQGITLKSEIRDVQILADPARLKQILLIVVDNALRHTPKGGQIMIETSRSERIGKVTVSDTGPGIPNEHIERVFDRFFKVKTRSNNESDGSGLGLSIAKSLMEAQKGTISIRNKSPHGVQVELAFPLSTM